MFKNFCNIEKETYNKLEGKSFNVVKGENLEIYEKNLLRTQRILMVMFWSYELNEKEESPYVSPKYIDEPSKVNKICIKDTLKHLGIKNDVVVDYESAIKKLLMKDNNGNCIYYSVWIFCGPKKPIFPDFNGQINSSNPNLVEEFINVLKIFWKNGGALVFFADGEPLNFQVNLFLEKVEFLNREKVKFKISGNYLGDKNLEQDITGNLDKKGVFDKSKKTIILNGKEIKRQSLSHNLGLIYEGYSIGYSVDKNNNKVISFGEFDKLYPFKPFSINTNGGISTLIYEADNQGRGDIIIDCGYTKCFLNMTMTDTFKFIQNIAGWTCRPEIQSMIENKLPWEWRPKGIDYKINTYAIYNYNEDLNLENKKTLFAIDYSTSTCYSDFYYEELKIILNNNYRNDRGDEIYFWNDEYFKIKDKEVLNLIFENKSIYGETNTSLIADIINIEKCNNFRHLVIVTDGQVTQDIIEEADIKMKKIDYFFDYVSVYILGETADLSVGAPFCRRTPNKTYLKRNISEDFIPLTTLSEDDIMIIDNLEGIDNYEDFMNEYEKILNAFQAQCIGTSGNKELKERIELVIKRVENGGIIDKPLFEKRKRTLIGITQGILCNTFTLEGIKAAIKEY